MSRRTLAGLFFISCLSAPGSAQPVAQGMRGQPLDHNCRTAESVERPEISVGSCIRSTLDERDPVIDNITHFEDYRLRLGAGESVRIDLDALPPRRNAPSAQGREPVAPFDAYVEIRRPAASVPLAENDDRSGPPPSLNSTLIFSAPEAGDYVVRARALYAGAGDYLLRVVAVQGDSIRELRLGAPPVESRIDLDDPRNDRGRYHEDYRLTLAAGQIVRIDLESTEPDVVGEVRFDPFLSVWALDGTEPLGVNDDRGDSLDARLVFVAPGDGVYLVRPEGLAGTTGNYRLAAVALQSVPLPDELGDRVEGRWFNGSHATEIDGQPVRYADYRFEGAAGERVQIDGESNLLPTLRLGRTDRAWFAQDVGSEGGERIRARIEAALPETATYIVRIEVPAPTAGTFDLRLRRLPPAEPPVPAE